MPANGTIAYVAELPECDICKHIGTPDERATPARAEYDIKTKQGAWAFACAPHREAHAYYSELGTGKGQQLQVTPAEMQDVAG